MNINRDYPFYKEEENINFETCDLAYNIWSTNPNNTNAHVIKRLGIFGTIKAAIMELFFNPLEKLKMILSAIWSQAKMEFLIVISVTQLKLLNKLGIPIIIQSY